MKSMNRFQLSLLRPVLLTFLIALSASSVLSQSLSIIKKGGSNYWVEATSEGNDPYTVQASENLHLWIDVQNDLQEPYSFELNSNGSSQRYFRLISSTGSPPPIRVMIIGDSMAADCCGWGRGVYNYFNENAIVVNYATPWASTKIFLQSEEYNKMLLIQPNYVLMQYGYIDGATTDPDRATTPEEFEANLKTIVETIRGFNGTPVLINLHAPRSWDAEGHLVTAWTTQNTIMKRVATELNTPFIDLYTITFDLFSKLGPSGTAFMEYTPGDNMHFSQAGGEYISRLLLNQVPDELGPYLTHILDPPPIP
jgi:lysophospholipase L1-like esterase